MGGERGWVPGKGSDKGGEEGGDIGGRVRGGGERAVGEETDRGEKRAEVEKECPLHQRKIDL